MHRGNSTSLYFHIRKQLLSHLDQYYFVEIIVLEKPDRDMKVLVPGCGSTSPWIWKYWAQDALILEPVLSGRIENMFGDN